MKKILGAVLLLYGLGVYAAEVVQPQTAVQTSRGRVKIIEATENIRYLSQKIAKEYLFFYAYPENRYIKKEMHRTLDALSQNLQSISAVTKDADTNTVLEFLAYSKEEILNILKKKPTENEAALMLDYSETLLEGADSIGQTYAYAFSKEEEMLVASKNLSYLLERIMKYYMALYSGYDNQQNKENLYASVSKLNDYLGKINAYEYPEEIKKIRHNINDVWHRDDQILRDAGRYFIPMLLADTVRYLEQNIRTVALYHSQNL